MKVSVLIPTYRYARYLPEAIESVLSQTGVEFEVVISDDASHDGTAEILQRYRHDPRVRAFVQPRNLGMVANWNWCLREARGTYVQCLCGDDRLESTRTLATLAAMLDRAPEAALASCARLIIDASARPVEIWDEMPYEGYHGPTEVIAHCMLNDCNAIGEPSAVMFRRQFAHRGFDPAWNQIADLEMWFHLLERGGLAYIAEPLCSFRRHALQQSAVNGRECTGTIETLLLVDRYFEAIRDALQARCSRGTIHRILFRNLYYAKKDSLRAGCRSVRLREAESRLRLRLPPRAYSLCWVKHRVAKPFRNLSRWISPIRSPGRRPYVAPEGLKPLVGRDAANAQLGVAR